MKLERGEQRGTSLIIKVSLVFKVKGDCKVLYYTNEVSPVIDTRIIKYTLMLFIILFNSWKTK